MHVDNISRLIDRQKANAKILILNIIFSGVLWESLSLLAGLNVEGVLSEEAGTAVVSVHIIFGEKNRPMKYACVGEMNKNE